MDFIGKCSGIVVGSSLTPAQQDAVCKVFDEAYGEFFRYVGYDTVTTASSPDATALNHNLMLYVGTRCTPTGVLLRLRRDFDIENRPKEWVLDALRDAASADYYYTFQKLWE
jgi:hypothetical protein